MEHKFHQANFLRNNQTIKSSIWTYFIWGLLAAITLWLSLNLHSRTGYFNYKSELYGDKAGYYIYLPATFIYSFDANQVPDTLSTATGTGFQIQDGKIFTKYPAGVAVMLSPFFVLTHYLVAPALGYPKDGFSPPYHKMVDFAAWLYAMLALILIWRVIRKRVGEMSTWLSIVFFFFGTNLFYYTAVESGMAHIYGFFLVCLLLYFLEVSFDWKQVTLKSGFLLGTILGLLILIRFTNSFFLFVVLFWNLDSLKQLKTRTSLFLRSWKALSILILPLFFFILQGSYYHYLSGSFFSYAYGNEHFNFLDSQLLKYWFSPNNGLILYAPIILFALFGLGIMIYKKQRLAWFPLLSFFVLSFIFASWWQWYFGCAFGGRSMIEFLPLLLPGLAHLIETINQQTRFVKISSISALSLICLLTFKNAYVYKLCFYGTHDWDWSFFWTLVSLG